MNYFDKYIKYKTKYLKYQKYIGGSAAKESFSAFIDRLKKTDIKNEYIPIICEDIAIDNKQINSAFSKELHNIFVEIELLRILYNLFGTNIQRLEDSVRIYELEARQQTDIILKYENRNLHISFLVGNSKFPRLMVFPNVELNIKNFIHIYAIFFNYYKTIKSKDSTSIYIIYPKLSEFIDSIPIVWSRYKNNNHITSFMKDNRLLFSSLKEKEDIIKKMRNCKEIF
jgi:hypothetical protein